MRKLLLITATLGLAVPATAQPVLWGGPGTQPQIVTVMPGYGRNDFIVQPMPGQRLPMYQTPQRPLNTGNMGCFIMPDGRPSPGC